MVSLKIFVWVMIMSLSLLAWNHGGSLIVDPDGSLITEAEMQHALFRQKCRRDFAEACAFNQTQTALNILATFREKELLLIHLGQDLNLPIHYAAMNNNMVLIHYILQLAQQLDMLSILAEQRNAVEKTYKDILKQVQQEER